MQRNPDTEFRWHCAVTEAQDIDTGYQRYLTFFHFFRKEKKGKMHMSVTERRCVIFSSQPSTCFQTPGSMLSKMKNILLGPWGFRLVTHTASLGSRPFNLLREFCAVQGELQTVGTLRPPKLRL